MSLRIQKHIARGFDQVMLFVDLKGFMRVAGPSSFFAKLLVAFAAVTFAVFIPAARAVETVLVGADSEWRYYSSQTPPPENWKSPAFNPEGWGVGRAQLGYGDGDEATVIPGAELNPKPVAAYFRRSFSVADPSTFSKLVLRLLRDDGAVVYLNGTEVARSNMPAGVITPETLASTAVGADAENLFISLEVPASALVAGENLVAVEVHQVNVSSTDLSFALGIIGVSGETPARPMVGIVAAQASTGEPGPNVKYAPGKFVITRSGSLDAALPVYLRYDGTATPDADYETLPIRVEIAAGSATAELLVAPKADSLNEPSETVVVKISEPPTSPDSVPYNIDAAHAAATVTIANTSPTGLPVVSIQATSALTSEPLPTALVAPGVFTVRRSAPSDTALTVWVDFAGTATAGVDYESVPNQVQFAAGQTEAEIKILPKADDLVEGDETVVAELSQPPTAGAIATYTIDAERRRAVVTIKDEDKTGVARIEITSPRNGAVLEVGTTVPVKATAVDPDGYIPRVEFFVDGSSIGVSEIAFVTAPEPGTPIYHTVSWKDIPHGEHVLTAKGVRANGEVVTSAPVTVYVLHMDPPPQTMLAVEVVDGIGAEVSSSDAVDTAVFLIKRVTGSTDIPITAYYELSGVAQNGVDYQKLTGTVEIAAGKMGEYVKIVPIRDELAEGEEPVILTLVPPPCAQTVPPPPDCYVVGDAKSGRVVIVDKHEELPAVKILRPINGAVFSLGQVIEIHAEAWTRDGVISKLEVLFDGKSLDTTIENMLTVQWSQGAIGDHTITARVIDATGQMARAEVHILIREQSAEAFVFRKLPAGYAPGAAFIVELRAEPPAGSRAYAVEDHPPVGWQVSEISNEGVFDPATGKVKFGPFTDATARTLTYKVLPPANATGRQEFGGVGSIDGANYRIGGDRIIEPRQSQHPADTDKNFAINVAELTAYAAAWRRGDDIPLSYVTRAGLIWRRGETYKFDGSHEPPFCWVPLQTVDGGTLAAASVMEFERVGSAETQPGVSAAFQLRIVPQAGTSAYAVEEKIPLGWSVANISHDGTFDATTGVIRWGMFFDATARIFTYTLTPPPGVTAIARLDGRVSFDGAVYAIPGCQSMTSTDSTTAPVIGKCESDGSKVRFELSGGAGQVGVLQSSTDLIHWQDVTTLYLPDGSVQFDDNASGVVRYYRLQIR